MNNKRTPAQQQRFDLKQRYPDCLLLFRLGDFYELFHDDAHVAHVVLGLTLTAKNKSSDDPIPMAGIPYHALDKYLPKLVSAGYKVAIAEQIGAVTPGSVVERDIVELITPGTYIEEGTQANNIIACRFGGEESLQYHCARGDYTLGTLYVQTVGSLGELCGIIETSNSKELIIHHAFPELETLSQRAEQCSILYTVHDHPHDMKQYIADILGVQTLEAFGSALQGGKIHAVSTLCSYIQHYQKKGTIRIDQISELGTEQVVKLDAITIKNLELFRSSYEGLEKQSLFGVINTTKTALGKRLLYQRLQFPSRSSELITYRNELITKFSEHKNLSLFPTLLGSIPDIPRIMSRIHYKAPSPQVVDGLRTVIDTVCSEKNILEGVSLCGFTESLQTELSGLQQYLSSALAAVIDSVEYGFIADSFDAEVDRLRQIAFHSDTLLSDYLGYLQTLTGSSTIKIKYVRNQGYCIEVTPRDAQLVTTKSDPDNEKDDFVRIQSLKNTIRFTSSYLQNLQENILNAQSALSALEYRLLDQIIAKILEHKTLIEKLSNSIALFDCAVSFAGRLNHGRVIPQIDTSKSISIRGGRHPVVEAFLPSNEQFIPNDYTSTEEGFFHCITGPNMGGKSTFLRQNALLLIMAHAGLPVPAESMSYYLVDGVFARVGSGDILAKNQSTFMTEMVEMAYIVRNATTDSFIILDELGRGTSTYDGMALAQALSVYICQKLSASTLFATHYHELTHLEELIAGFVNYSVSVYESGNEVVFLKKIVPGGASKSYGLDVAKIAGIPQEIVTMAQDYLLQLQSTEKSLGAEHTQKVTQQGFDFGPINDQNKLKIDAIKALFKDIDPNALSPLEGLILVHKILGLLE